MLFTAPLLRQIVHLCDAELIRQDDIFNANAYTLNAEDWAEFSEAWGRSHNFTVDTRAVALAALGEMGETL